MRPTDMSDIPVLDTRPPEGLAPGSVAANKLTKRLRRLAGKAIVDYGMIRDGDRIMVCLSGGKDSYALLDVLSYLQEVAPVRFTLRAVNLDQKQPGFPEHILPAYLRGLGVDYEIVERDTYSIVTDKVPEGRTMCGLCSRLRRGILYRYARENGFNRIALGHHRDDIVETLFLNMFHGSRMAAMPPKLKSDDGDNVVIRPLAYCAERDLEKYARLKQFPIIPCNLCGSQANLQRQNIKAMLVAWEVDDPGRTQRIFRSMTRIAPSQMADPALFDFASLEPERDAMHPTC
jgi:tRNA 2-thiocytidine biosynthesis protein TtcA